MSAAFAPRPRLRASAPCVLGLLASLAVACGGSAPPAVAPGPAEPKGAPAAPPDLSAVPEPPNVLLFARAARPGASLDEAARWVLPGAPSVSAGAADGMARALTGENLGKMLDLTKSVDSVMTMDLASMSSRRGFAVSLALRDPEGARRVFGAAPYKLTPLGGGAFRVEGLGPPHEEEDEDDGDEGEGGERGCGLFPAYGDAPLRLVCGEGYGLFRTLAPYLARTVTRTPSPSDLHFEVRLAPVHAYLEKNRGQFAALAAGLANVAGPRGSLGELASAFLGELVDTASDLEVVAFDGRLEDQSCEMRTQWRVRGRASFLARASLSRTAKVDVAPPALLRLPKDAGVAAYGRGVDDEEMARPRQIIGKAVRDLFVEAGASAADGQAVADAVAPLVRWPAWTGAQGIDVAAVEKDLDRLGAKAARSPQALLAAGLFTWAVGVLEDGGSLPAQLKALAAAWARPGIQKVLRSIDDELPLPTVKLATVPAKAGLPKGTVALDLTTYVPPATHDADAPAPKKGAKKATKPEVASTYRMLAVADGGQSYWAFARTQDAAAARLKALLDPKTAETLAARPGIEAVRDARAMGAGFVDLRTLALLTGSVLAMADDSAKPFREALRFVGKDADAAQTFMPVVVTAEKSGDQGGTVRTSARIPRKMVERIAGYVMRASADGS